MFNKKIELVKARNEIIKYEHRIARLEHGVCVYIDIPCDKCGICSKY